MSQMLKIDAGLGASITNTKRIISFRNILIHGYATVADELVWGILEADLPALRREIADLLTDSMSE